VHTPQQIETDLYRVILIAAQGTELLFLPERGLLRLPSLPIPRRQRIAEHLTTSVRREWCQEAVSLFGFDASSASGESHYQVMESIGALRFHVAGFRWIPVSSLDETQFEQRTEWVAIVKALADYKECPAGRNHVPIGRLGWFAELTEWTREQVRPAGLTLTGNFQQLNASPTFSLVRFETNGSAIWFKAVGEPNLREYSITLGLAKYFPAFVPRVIAMRSDWNGWLAIEAAGTHPNENSDIELWTSVATTFAEMQIASLGQRLHLVNMGCRDTRVSTLVELVEPFVEVMAELMERQTKELPPALSRSELRTLQTQLHDALSEAADSEIPNAIGHLDFNPSNIVASHNGCVFLDWSEGCSGHPFLTFQYLMQHLRRLHNGDECWESAITSRYLDNWRSFVSPKEITKALNVSPLLAVFAYAVSLAGWHELEHRTLPEVAGYFRSLTRRMKREGDRWVAHETAGDVPCLR
jgi:hypothetical protein